MTVDSRLTSNGDGTFTTPTAGDDYAVTFTYDQQQDTGTPGGETSDDVSKKATVSFTAVPAVIHFDGNKAETGEVADIEGNKHDTVTLPEEGFVHNGYTLTGWNTAADGSGTAYPLGEEVELVDTDLTLYAQWEKVSEPNVPSNPGGSGSEQPGTPVSPTRPATPASTAKPPVLATTGSNIFHMERQSS